MGTAATVTADDEAMMPLVKIAFGLALVALVSGAAGTASAEPSSTTRELSAQGRPHIVIRPRQTTPGPNARRYCRSWLQKEYRASGPVITPQMRCWWR
jgi:hypothetical protein